MRGEILGVECRRRWSDEAKLEIVLSVGMGGATLTQRHDVARSQIYGWRRELQKKGLRSRIAARSSCWCRGATPQCRSRWWRIPSRWSCGWTTVDVCGSTALWRATPWSG